MKAKYEPSKQFAKSRKIKSQKLARSNMNIHEQGKAKEMQTRNRVPMA